MYMPLRLYVRANSIALAAQRITAILPERIIVRRTLPTGHITGILFDHLFRLVLQIVIGAGLFIIHIAVYGMMVCGAVGQVLFDIAHKISPF